MEESCWKILLQRSTDLFWRERDVELVYTNKSGMLITYREPLEKESKSGDIDRVTHGATLGRANVSISGYLGR